MDKVKSYIEANKERFISELFDLLRIPSISAQSEHKPDMTRCAEWLAAALAKAGADRTEVFPTEGNPVVYAEKIVDPKAKTVLVYGHYDVMPVDPRGEWRTEPFEPVIKDGRIWGRGADDDKGQLWMHAKAFEAMCATESLPCNVKFMLEGEEEIGSPSLYKFCEQNKKMLKADIILVSDTTSGVNAYLAYKSACAHTRRNRCSVHFKPENAGCYRSRNHRGESRRNPNSGILDDIAHLKHTCAETLRNKSAPFVLTKAHYGKAYHLSTAACKSGSAGKTRKSESCTNCGTAYR